MHAPSGSPPNARSWISESATVIIATSDLDQASKRLAYQMVWSRSVKITTAGFPVKEFGYYLNDFTRQYDSPLK